MERRLLYELDTICQVGYARYFLIVRDFIDFARANGIGVGPGRGSAAGSLVSYVLGITDIDPLKFDLLFERFLNPERISMPDIDIDFDYENRGRVIEYVLEKYGRDSVTQIITFGTMAARAVVRDVGRALGMTYADQDRVAKLVLAELRMTLTRALETVPELKALSTQDETHAKLIRCSLALEGLARHASTHAAGVLIAPGKLTDYVPVYRSSKGDVTTQFDMVSLEKIGLLKMDFLGLRTLTVLEDAARLASGAGERLDLKGIPLDDPATFALLSKGQTIGVFQLESSGMRELLRKVLPDSFEDIIAIHALFRPGPIQRGLRAPLLPVRVPQGAPSRRLLRGGAEQRSRGYRPHRGAGGGGAPAGDRGESSRREPEPVRLHPRGERGSLRAHCDQERGQGVGGGDRRGAPERRAVRLDLGPVPEGRSEIDQQARPRIAGACRRLRLPGRRPGPALRGGRPGHREVPGVGAGAKPRPGRALRRGARDRSPGASARRRPLLAAA